MNFLSFLSIFIFAYNFLKIQRVRSLNSFKSKVFRVNNQNFEQQALELFRFQYRNNTIYHNYVSFLNLSPDKVRSVSQIPFLPIQLFKQHKIVTGSFTPEHVFESSGTTGASTSKHYIEDLEFYRQNSTHIFNSFFGKIKDAIIIGLLPSYLERTNSSLVYMVDHFIRLSQQEESGFYLDNIDLLSQKLKLLSKGKTEIFLFGVTFALLELAAHSQFEAKNVTILETGGMKGRGRELTREELHHKLKQAFHTERVFSEYGMTELLSQAYMLDDGYFHSPPWMAVSAREIHDPFQDTNNSRVGLLKVIDLANVHSCAFIETEDLGLCEGNRFKVIGRLDNADIRGCNLLTS